MITLLYFGQIQSATNLSKEDIEFTGNLESLRLFLLGKYPKLENAHFVFSVNKKINSNCEIKDNDEVALMPPFSGG